MNTAHATILCQPLHVERVSLYAIPGLMKHRTKMMAYLEPHRYFEELLECTAQMCNVTTKQILGPARYRHIVTARYLVAYMMRTKTTLSMKAIGRLINRDHTTVIHALAAVNDWIYIKDPAAEMLNELKKKV